jgi:hypothetical protein
MQELRAKIQASFDLQKWDNVTDAFEKMASLDESTIDVETILKAAAAYVFPNVHQQPSDKKNKDLHRAVELGRKIIAAVPSIAEGFVLSGLEGVARTELT